MATPQSTTIKMEDPTAISDFCQPLVPTMTPTSTPTSNQSTSLDLSPAEGQQQFPSLAPALPSMAFSGAPAPATAHSATTGISFPSFCFPF